MSQTVLFGSPLAQQRMRRKGFGEEMGKPGFGRSVLLAPPESHVSTQLCYVLGPMQPAGCAHNPKGAAGTDLAGRRLGATVFIALLVAGAEWGGGVYAGSLALLADAGHMGLDVAALLLAYVARRLGRRPATRRSPFGLQRAEVMAALVNGLLLLVVAAVIAHEALERAAEPASVDATTMGLTAAAGFVANVACLRLLHGHQHDIGMRGAFLHLLGDAANSLAVVVGALCIYASGNATIDVGVSLCIAAVVALSSVPLIGHAMAIVLLLAPHPEADAQLERDLQALAHVRAVHALRVWRVSSQSFVVSAKLAVSEPGKASEVVEAAHAAIQTVYAKADITVQASA